MPNYYCYYDSGTTNTRIYLLNKDFELIDTAKRNVGSKDTSISGDNGLLIQCFYDLYQEVLEKNHLKDEDIIDIYASGMTSSPYGLMEVPHLELPLTLSGFAGRLAVYHENRLLKRDIYIVPGLKRLDKDLSFNGNMRGEEIEIMGALDELKKRNVHDVAIILPGSHTHVTRVVDDKIEDIISNMSGELFYALKSDTILAPILAKDYENLDKEMVKLGVKNVIRFGFNRAVYIAHAMRILETAGELERYSYCEGVVNGGIRQILEYYLAEKWQGCRTICLIANDFMAELFKTVFEDCEYIDEIICLPLNEDTIYSIKGLKKIVEVKNNG